MRGVDLLTPHLGIAVSNVPGQLPLVHGLCRCSVACRNPERATHGPAGSGSHSSAQQRPIALASAMMHQRGALAAPSVAGSALAPLAPGAALQTQRWSTSQRAALGKASGKTPVPSTTSLLRLPGSYLRRAGLRVLALHSSGLPLTELTRRAAAASLEHSYAHSIIQGKRLGRAVATMHASHACTQRLCTHGFLPHTHPTLLHAHAAAPNNGSYIFITFCALSVAVAALILNLLSNLLMLWNLHNAPGSNVQVGVLLGSSAHGSSVLGNPCCCDSREIANGDWGAGRGIQGRPSVQQHSTCIALGRQESWVQQLTGVRRILSWAAHLPAC